MTNEEIIYAALQNTGYKVFYGKAPQNEVLPFVIYQTVQRERPFGSTTRLNISRTQFQVDVYAKEYTDVRLMFTAADAEIYKIGLVHSSSDSIDEDGYRIQIEASVRGTD